MAIFRTTTLSALCLLATLLGARQATADGSVDIPTASEAARVNEDTVGVVFTHEELFHQLVHNMEDELELESGLRIVPIMGKNHVQSVFDLLYLHGVDLALVRADAIEYVRRHGDKANIDRLTHNIARVSDETLVVIATDDVASIEQLDGEKVGFGVPGSGEFVTGTIAFETMGIEPVALEVDVVDAIGQLESGELAAMVYLLRAPDAIQTGADLKAREAVIALTGEDGLQVLELPATPSMNEIYRPITLSHEELALVPEGKELATYSVDLILAAYNWRDRSPRQIKQERFVEAFVGGLDGLATGAYQPAWKRLDLSLETPNVTRSPLVAARVEKSRLEQAERERVAATLIEEEQVRAREAEVATARIARLTAKRAELVSMMDEKLEGADPEELRKVLERLDQLLTRESDAASAERD